MTERNDRDQRPDERPSAAEQADRTPIDWPQCPQCGARRLTRCPVCRTTGNDFRQADPDYAETLGVADDATPLSTCGCGSDACRKEGTPEYAEQPDQGAAAASEPADAGPPAEQELTLLCPTCDEPFLPKYARLCPECGHEFEEGFEVEESPAAEHYDYRAVVLIVLMVAIVGGLLLYFANLAPGAEAGVIASGAKVEKLAGGFDFTEGPAADAQGNVFFTDQPKDRILKWSVDGKSSTFMQPSGRSNGLCFDSQGNLWACADEKNELWRIDPAGKVHVVVKDYHGRLLNGPNDAWIRPDGGLYFTDPFYKRTYWKRGPREQDRDCVYYLSPDAKKLSRVAEDLKQPNGIIGTPDGKTLYVTDLGAKKTYVYRIQPDGTIADKRLFCDMGSDGMTIDSEGNVYLTGKGVFVFDKSGKQIEHIAVEEPWTANVCFGAADGHTLFITATKGLYGIRMRVHGVGSQ